MTGTFQLFYLGVGAGGPAYWWSWPMVFIGQLMIALNFAELAGKYPVAGSVYNWSKRIGNKHVAWLAGWFMLVASVLALAAVVLAEQRTIPEVSHVFQFIGDADNPSPSDFAKNAVLLGGALILISTIINAFGVKLMSRINSTGVMVELIAAVALIIALALHFTRGPQVVFDTQGHGVGQAGGYVGAFLIASLASAYVMYGFDTAATLGEETINPRQNAPKAVLRALVWSFILGGLILLFALMAAEDLNAPEITTIGIQYILLSVLGDVLGKTFLIAVIIAVMVCALAVHTAAVRMAFAMARDTNLPFSRQIAKVSPRFNTPTVPIIGIAIFAALVLVVNINQPQIFSVVTSIAVVVIYMAYLAVTIPLLVARLRGRWPEDDDNPSSFDLGRWGLPVNIIAVIWGAGMAINLLWPRSEIYNADPPFHWYLRWGGVLAVAAMTVGGLLFYWFRQRHHTGMRAGHAALRPGEAPSLEAGPA